MRKAILKSGDRAASRIDNPPDPSMGSALSDIGEGAKVGGSIAAATAAGLGIAAAAGSTTAAAIGTAAGAAFGISAAIGTAIPIPILGTVIGAIVGAFAALGVALKDLTACTYHPDAPSALAWLLLFQVAPGLIYSNVDEINTETKNAAEYASRNVRYLRLVGGIVTCKQADGSPCPLYNPECVRSANKVAAAGNGGINPYIETAEKDPSEPLTDMAFCESIRQQVVNAGHRSANPSIPSMIKTPVEAQAALKLLRSKSFKDSGIFGWCVLNNAPTMADLRLCIGKIRALAGETGDDPVLNNLFQGDVTPTDADIAAAKAAPTTPVKSPQLPVVTPPKSAPKTESASGRTNAERNAVAPVSLHPAMPWLTPKVALGVGLGLGVLALAALAVLPKEGEGEAAKRAARRATKEDKEP